MGSTLSSSRFDLASPYWQLQSEVVALSLAKLNESADIFLGDTDSWAKGSEGDTCRTSAYPRHLSLRQFEEVFGMLVSDAGPHFAFFTESSSAATVCAHVVFCSLALVARADLHAKIHFLLRLYAVNDHGQLPLDRKRQVVLDVVDAIPRVLNLAAPIETEVVSYLEKALVVGEDSGTCRDFYHLCFTTARVSGYLHGVQAVVDELSQFRERHPRNGRVPQQEKELYGGRATGGGTLGQSGRLKLLNRGSTTLQLPSLSPLWTLRARDLVWAWSQDSVQVAIDVTVGHALLLMRESVTETVFAVTGSSPAVFYGLLTIDDLHNYLMDLLPTDLSSTSNMSEYARLQIVKACSLFQATLMSTVLSHATQTTDSSTSSEAERLYAPQRHLTVSEDECLFNTIVRFICGASAVAVVDDTMPLLGELSHSSNDYVSSPFLGCISIYDVLHWLLEDVSLLNGRERWAVRSFPRFYCSPVGIHTGTESNRQPSVLDALITMKTSRVSGILMTRSDPMERRVLGPQVLAHTSLADGDPTSNKGDLTASLISMGDILHPCHCVSGDDSLAAVVCIMTAKRTRRVYISDDGTQIQGVIRATDILKVLLQEQHRKSRR